MKRTDPPTEPVAGGKEPKKPKKGRKAATSTTTRSKPASDAPAESGPLGRLGSDLREKKVRWLVKPWFQEGILSFVIGRPQVGKSTFISWLIAQAGTAMVLPGFEEDVEVSTMQRMKHNGVNMRQVRILDERRYVFPRDKQMVANAVKSFGARLLVLDPVDSYMEDNKSENSGTDVRDYLESLAFIAHQTGAAVVGVRHPGKDPANLFPGSRQWRAVPRSVVELTSDYRSPPRCMIRHVRDPLGLGNQPRGYRLVGERGQPRIFELTEQLDSSLEVLTSFSDDAPTQKGLVQAAKILKQMLTDEEKPLVEDYVTLCVKQGVSVKARDAARHHLGIDSHLTEPRGKWFLLRTSKEWPKWLIEAERQAKDSPPL